MSVWYHYNVTVIAEDEKAVAKFFNLDPKGDVHIDRFEFSFGQKNIPGLRLGKLIEENPGLIFLVQETIEYDTASWWIERADPVNKKAQYIPLEDSGEYTVEINKKILEAYTKKFPSLPAKHLTHEKGFEGFRWSMFFSNFTETAEILSRADEYKEMISPMEPGELEELELA